MMELTPLSVDVLIRGDRVFTAPSFDEAGRFATTMAEHNVETGVEIHLPVLSYLNVKYFGKYEESGLLWGVFPREWSDEEIEDAWIANGASPWRTKCHEGDWDCCGRLFRSSIRIVRKGSRALATQYWGYDI
jgi:hypothetical protein